MNYRWRLLGLSLLACSVEPCGWHRITDWTPPPREELPDSGCVYVVAAHGVGVTGLPVDLEECTDLDRCVMRPPEQAFVLAAYADTSIAGWDSLPMPRLLVTTEQCRDLGCSEISRRLVAGQDEEER